MKIRHQYLAVSLVGVLSGGCAAAEISLPTIQNKGVQQMQNLSQQQ